MQDVPYSEDNILMNDSLILLLSSISQDTTSQTGSVLWKTSMGTWIQQDEIFFEIMRIKRGGYYLGCNSIQKIYGDNSAVMLLNFQLTMVQHTLDRKFSRCCVNHLHLTRQLLEHVARASLLTANDGNGKW